VPRPAALAAGAAPQTGPCRRPVGSGSAEGGFLAQGLAGGIQAAVRRLRRSGRRTATIRAEKAAALKKRCPSSALADQRRHKPRKRRPGSPCDRRRPPQNPPPAQARHITGIGFRPVGPVKSSSAAIIPWSTDQRRRERGAASPAQRGNPLPNNEGLWTRASSRARSAASYRAGRGRTDVRIELREHAEYQLAQSVRC